MNASCSKSKCSSTLIAIITN